MSDSKFSSGVAFLTMLKFAYFWLLGVHLGSQRGPLRDSTLQNMTFGMSFDSLMTIARKRNGSKKSQSLGSDIMCHITLKVQFLLKSLLMLLIFEKVHLITMCPIFDSLPLAFGAISFLRES